MLDHRAQQFLDGQPLAVGENDFPRDRQFELRAAKQLVQHQFRFRAIGAAACRELQQPDSALHGRGVDERVVGDQAQRFEQPRQVRRDQHQPRVEDVDRFRLGRRLVCRGSLGAPGRRIARFPRGSGGHRVGEVRVAAVGARPRPAQ